jgi:Phosphotransferase enzyme family
MHRRTSQLTDPALPELGMLLAKGVPAPLQAALGPEGVTVVDSHPTQVTWQPGISVTVRYQVTLRGAGFDGPEQLVATAGHIPSGALVVQSERFSVGVWRVPHDPKLRGLPAAVDRIRVTELLNDLGAPETEVSTRLRAYRPGRRAVVEARGSRHSIYLKVLRSERVERLHRHHLHLSPHLPIPESMGFSSELGIVALQTLPGVTLRNALDDQSVALPNPSSLADCLQSLPSPIVEHRAPSAIGRLPEIARLLRALMPEHSHRLDALSRRIGEDSLDERVPVHGDFYEAQIMVKDARVVGILDVDTYGWGHPADDLATMVGHLSVWQSLSRETERVRSFGQELLRHADQRVDPADLRRRVAAVVLSLAPGPFRVLLPDWPDETERRISLAERWLESADRIDKGSLMPVSPRSYLVQTG